MRQHHPENDCEQNHTMPSPRWLTLMRLKTHVSKHDSFLMEHAFSKERLLVLEVLCYWKLWCPVLVDSWSSDANS